jgi:hypothetical protein
LLRRVLGLVSASHGIRCWCFHDDSFPRSARPSGARGQDAAIVANRDLVVQALIAAELLAKKGRRARHRLHAEAADEQMVLKAACDTGAVVTAENNIVTAAWQRRGHFGGKYLSR